MNFSWIFDRNTSFIFAMWLLYLHPVIFWNYICFQIKMIANNNTKVFAQFIFGWLTTDTYSSQAARCQNSGNKQIIITIEKIQKVFQLRVIWYLNLFGLTLNVWKIFWNKLWPWKLITSVPQSRISPSDENNNFQFLVFFSENLSHDTSAHVQFSVRTPFNPFFNSFCETNTIFVELEAFKWSKFWI